MTGIDNDTDWLKIGLTLVGFLYVTTCFFFFISGFVTGNSNSVGLLKILRNRYFRVK